MGYPWTMSALLSEEATCLARHKTVTADLASVSSLSFLDGKPSMLDSISSPSGGLFRCCAKCDFGSLQLSERV